MKDILIIFVILLAILLLISTLGGSMKPTVTPVVPEYETPLTKENLVMPVFSEQDIVLPEQPEKEFVETKEPEDSVNGFDNGTLYADFES